MNRTAHCYANRFALECLSEDICKLDRPPFVRTKGLTVCGVGELASQNHRTPKLSHCGPVVRVE